MRKRDSFVHHRKLAAGAAKALAELSPGTHGVVAAFAIQSPRVFPLWARPLSPPEEIASFELLAATVDAASLLPRPKAEFMVRIGAVTAQATIYRLTFDRRAGKFRAHCEARDDAALALTQAVADGAREFSVV